MNYKFLFLFVVFSCNAITDVLNTKVRMPSKKFFLQFFPEGTFEELKKQMPEKMVE